MKIKILNKNLRVPGYYTSAKIYDVDEGCNITECYNETLDSAVFIVSNIEYESNRIKMEPYDIVEILDDLGNHIRYMCLDSYTETMISVKPKIYKYEIHLFSETKQLEGIILPNLKITKVWGETRTIYQYINRYLTEYAPQIRIGGETIIEAFDSWWGDELQWEGDHYEVLVDFGTDSTDYQSVPVPTDKLRIDAYAWVDDGINDEYFHDTNCHIYYNYIDEDGHWRVRFGIDVGTLEGYVIDNLQYGSEDVEVYNHNGYRYQYKWSWSALESKFTQECPEMQWNTPTLREVLNDLMMVQDCIPVLKDGVLEFLDLTKTYSDVTDSGYINYVSRSKSSEDYVSEIQTNLENVTNTIENINNYATKSEWHTFTCPDDEATMSTENLVLKTKYPIYNIKSVKLLFPIRYGTTIEDETVYLRKWLEYDLCDLPKEGSSGTFNIISEYKEWITKPIAYNSNPPSNFEDWANYQTWSLYYTRGGYEISNWNSKLKFKWLNQTSTLWQIIIANLIPSNDIPTDSGTTTRHYNYLFKIEYETLAGCLFRASKNECPEHEKVIIDNQTNSMVNSYAQGFLEYQKANRLGNEQVQINVRYPSDYVGDMIKIGDIYEDSIVYQVQYQYYKNHTEVNAIATKNYVLREYFTGVKSKIRSWKIASGDEALIRHDLEKYYCEFSYTLHPETDGLSILTNNQIALYFVSPIYEYEQAPIKYGYIRTRYLKAQPYHPLEFYYPSYNKYYEIDTVSRVVGNSLVFTLGFDDNYWAGKSYHTDAESTSESGTHVITYNSFKNPDSGNIALVDSVLLSNSGVPTYQHRYANDNGEFTDATIIFANGIKVIPEDEYDDPQNGDEFGPRSGQGGSAFYDQTKKFLYYIYQRPVTYEKNIKSSDYSTPYDYEVFSLKFNHKKDSQEITKMSIQMEFCSDTTDISIGKMWLTKQRAINTNDYPVSGIKLVFHTANKYNFKDPNNLPSGGWIEEGSAEVHSYTSNNEACVSMYIIYKKTAYANSTVARNKAIELKTDAALYLSHTNFDRPNVLLSLNNIPDGNCFGLTIAEDGNYYPAYLIHMNILKTRNKNIYDEDNHYLINSKL